MFRIIIKRKLATFLPNLKSQICESFFFNFSQILSAGIDHEIGLLNSPRIPVADSSKPPR